MKKLFTYFGGKRATAQKIIEIIRGLCPEAGTKNGKELVVPFAGGLTIPFAMNAKTVIANDAFGDLISAYRCLFTPGLTEKFIEFYSSIPKLEGILSELAQNPPANIDPDVVKATRFFLFLSGAFAGKLAVYDRNRFHCYNWRLVGRLDNPLRRAFKELHQLQWTFFSRDFHEFLKLYPKKKRVGAIYLDPPYWNENTNAYAVKFSEQDHLDLREILGKISHPWFLSYNDSEKIRSVYADFNIIKMEYRNAIYATQSNDVLISNRII